VSDLVKDTLALLRLRAGPQDLPSSWLLTGAAIAVLAVQAMVSAQSLSGPGEAARSVLALAIQLTAVTIMLRLRGLSERLQQTLLALALTGIVLGVLAYLFLMQANPEVDQPLLAIVWFGIFGWSLAVDANIFRHAFGVTMSTGVLIAVLLLAGTYVLLELAFR
jgi:hypothetical protein